MRHDVDDARVFRLRAGDSQISPSDEPLLQFLDRYVTNACEREAPVRNENKGWTVQFAVKTDDESSLVAKLQKLARI